MPARTLGQEHEATATRVMAAPRKPGHHELRFLHLLKQVPAGKGRVRARRFAFTGPFFPWQDSLSMTLGRCHLHITDVSNSGEVNEKEGKDGHCLK